MLKSELIRLVGRRFDQLSEQDITYAINYLLEQISGTLGHGKRIEIRGFGSFNLHYRAERLAHNPKTGEKFIKPAKYAVHFKPGKELRENINQSRHNPLKDVEEKDE